MVKFVERAIAAVSPATALRRAKARAKITALDTATKIREQASGDQFYSAAAGGRNTPGVGGRRGASADSVNRRAAPTLRERSRDEVRNGAIGAIVVTRHTDYIVGDGIVPKARTGDPELDKKIDALFDEFSANCDPEGLQNFFGLQVQMCRGMIEGGEMLARKRTRLPADGLKVPLQVQTMESEFLDTGRLQAYAPNSQNRVVDGIEFDALGRRRGYWLHSRHPNDGGVVGYPLQSSFVLASDVAHLFERQRNQIRGVPWLSPVLNDIGHLNEYSDAELVRKKIEACYVGLVTPGDDEEDEEGLVGAPLDRTFDPDGNVEFDQDAPDDASLPAGVYDMNGDPVERFEPGMFGILRGGKDVKFNSPAVSSGTEAWVRTQLRRISSGVRMPYEVMTGDLSLVSYASGRMGEIQYRRFIRGVQWNIFIPMFCAPVWRWFVEAIKLAGHIKADLVVPVEWTTPRFESINPIDDTKSDLQEVRAGFKSWDEVVKERGFDPDKVAAQIVARNQFWDDNKVILDIDPRYISTAGQKHQQAGGGSTAPPAGED